MNMEKSKGRGAPQIDNFSVDAGNILCFLYQELGIWVALLYSNSQQGKVHNEHAIMFGDGTNENLEERNIIIFQQLKIPGRYLSALYYQIW